MGDVSCVFSFHFPSPLQLTLHTGLTQQTYASFLPSYSLFVSAMERTSCCIFSRRFNQHFLICLLLPSQPRSPFSISAGYRFIGTTIFLVAATLGGALFYVVSPKIFPDTPFCCGHKGSLAGHIVVSLIVGKVAIWPTRSRGAPWPIIFCLRLSFFSYQALLRVCSLDGCSKLAFFSLAVVWAW